MAKKASTAKKTTKASTKKASKRKSAKKVAKVASNPAPVQGPPRDNPDAIGKVSLSLMAELGRTRETIGTVGGVFWADGPRVDGCAGCVESGERVVRAVNDRNCVPAVG